MSDSVGVHDTATSSPAPAVNRLAIPAGAGVPTLAFEVAGVHAEPYAATPTLRFVLDVSSDPGKRVRSVMLTAQIRISVARRAYDRDEQERLSELFGSPERWNETAKSLYWTHATVVIAPFEGRTQVNILVPCTYDFDVAVAKYFHGVERGSIPLELLFSGSVFYDDEHGVLKTARISWDAEATYGVPISVWKEMMEHYFPQSTWMRIRRDTFDRLYAYKAQGALPTWEQALDALLDASDRRVAGV